MKDQIGHDIEIDTYYVSIFRKYKGKQRIIAGKAIRVQEPNVVVLEDVCLLTMCLDNSGEVVSEYELSTKTHRVGRKTLYWLHPNTIKETYHNKTIRTNL